MVARRRTHRVPHVEYASGAREVLRELLGGEIRIVSEDGVPYAGMKDAGQTVPHLHIHVMPRCAGDAADPRGGVR